MNVRLTLSKKTYYALGMLSAALTMTVSQLLAFGLRFGGKLLMIWSRGRKAPEMKQEASA